MERLTLPESENSWADAAINLLFTCSYQPVTNEDIVRSAVSWISEFGGKLTWIPEFAGSRQELGESGNHHVGSHQIELATVKFEGEDQCKDDISEAQTHKQSEQETQKSIMATPRSVGCCGFFKSAISKSRL